MSKQTIADKIRLENPALSSDLQDKFQLVLNTACRVDTVTSFATGTMDAHEPEDYENLLELLREENGLLHQHTKELGELMSKIVQVFEFEPRPVVTLKETDLSTVDAIKNCLKN